jgi:hypothetical protein
MTLAWIAERLHLGAPGHLACLALSEWLLWWLLAGLEAQYAPV